MSQRTPPFAALRAFDQVGRTGGIRKAAEALGVSHAIVSRHVAGLEEALGTVLLNRRTGALTEAGSRYHARISAAISEIAAATQTARSASGGALTIWCSPGFALHWLTRRLSDFASGGLRPMIDLRATDVAPNIDRNEADGDIRYYYDDQLGESGASPGKNLRVEILARPLVFPVAAPGLLAQPIASLEDMLGLPLIQEASDSEWLLWLRAQGRDCGALSPRIARYGQSHLALAAARAGQGVALANHFLAAEDLAAGRLVPVEPSGQRLLPVTLGAYIFRCARARWRDPVMERFRLWLREAVAKDNGGHDEPDADLA